MKAKEPGAATPTCTPPSTASPTWPTPRPSAVEKASTTIGFFCRARAFLAAHGVTRLVRVVTDNGASYRAQAFTTTITSLVSRHQRIRPYTPQHNGKVERYNRILWTAGGFSDSACFVLQAAFFRSRKSLSASFGVRYPRAE